MAKDSKKKPGAAKFDAVNNVKGSCSMMRVTITAKVVFPQYAEPREVFAFIVKASNGDPVSGPHPMVHTGGGEYGLRDPLTAPAPGVSYNWTFANQVNPSFVVTCS